MPATIKRATRTTASKTTTAKTTRYRGYFYKGVKSCWVESQTHKLLRDANGDKLTDPNETHQSLGLALQRFHHSQEQSARVAADEAGSGAGESVAAICSAYLADVHRTQRDATFRSRQDSLFDFAFGLPAGLREKFVAGKLSTKEIAAARIHDGLGALTVGQCKFFHLTAWLAAHPTWLGCTRSKIQAVKRAFNWAVEQQRIGRNPFKGYKTPKANERLTFITAEQESLIYANCKPTVGQAIRILIRTGCRPHEFTNLTAAHISFSDGVMVWTYAPGEVKNKIVRKIYILDPEIIAATREAMAAHPSGKIWYGPAKGKRIAWTVPNLSGHFTRIKSRLAELGKPLDADSCLYSTRHTFAKLCLNGAFNGGEATTVETLAVLMGNTPDVARKYAKDCPAYQQPLLRALGRA